MDSIVNGWQILLAYSRWLSSLRRNTAAGGNVLRILAFIPEGCNRRMLKAMASEAGWSLTISNTPPSAVAKVAGELAPIILFDRELPPGNWREAVSILTGRSPRPYLILLSPNTDGNLWDELQRLGGSDILRTPIDRTSTVDAVDRAWSLWLSQQQLRWQLQHQR